MVVFIRKSIQIFLLLFKWHNGHSWGVTQTSRLSTIYNKTAQHMTIENGKSFKSHENYYILVRFFCVPILIIFLVESINTCFWGLLPSFTIATCLVHAAKLEHDQPQAIIAAWIRPTKTKYYIQTVQLNQHKLSAN